LQYYYIISADADIAAFPSRKKLKLR